MTRSNIISHVFSPAIEAANAVRAGTARWSNLADAGRAILGADASTFMIFSRADNQLITLDQHGHDGSTERGWCCRLRAVDRRDAECATSPQFEGVECGIQ